MNWWRLPTTYMWACPASLLIMALLVYKSSLAHNPVSQTHTNAKLMGNSFVNYRKLSTDTEHPPNFYPTVPNHKPARKSLTILSARPLYQFLGQPSIFYAIKHDRRHKARCVAHGWCTHTLAALFHSRDLFASCSFSLNSMTSIYGPLTWATPA